MTNRDENGYVVDHHLEYAEYGSDNWQRVDKVTGAYPCDGEWIIAGEWFADKPQRLCFRLRQIQLVDHRGIPTDDVWNKTGDAIEALEWVTCGMVTGPTGTFSITREVWKSWTCGLDEECNHVHTESEIFTFDGTAIGNGMFIEQGEIDGNSSTSRVSLSIHATPIGMPLALVLCPDGTEILEAKAEITGGTITRTKTVGNNPPDTTVGAIDCWLIGFKSHEEFDVITVLPGAGALATKVVDFTAAARAMIEHREQGLYPYGYGLAFSPIGLDGDSLEDFLPGEGPSQLVTAPEGSPCEGASYHEFEFGFNDVIQWSNPNINQVSLRLKYPDDDVNRTLVTPTWPSMGPVV